MTSKSKKHYVNNKDLFEALKAYRADCEEAEFTGEQKPRVPPYIGEALHLIATRYSTKPNFINYPFIDDMISDALENCISLGVDNFNPEKTNNPFAYFTQIIHFAFIRRINKEKKHLYIKYKTMQNLYLNGALSNQQEIDELKEVDASYLDNDYMNNLVTNYEDSLKEKKAKAKARQEK